MALSIKDEELDRKVRRLAALKKTSFTGAIRIAVDNELARDEASARIAPMDFDRALQEARARIRATPVDPTRAHLTEDEILGYDENGVPAPPQ